MDYIIVLNIVEYLHALLGPEEQDDPELIPVFVTRGLNGPEKYTPMEINQILYN